MEYLIKNQYWNLNEDYDKEKLLYLLIDRSDKIGMYGDFYWVKNNKKHRDYDFPAATSFKETISWYIDGNYCRFKSKPVIIWFDGVKQYQ